MGEAKSQADLHLFCETSAFSCFDASPASAPHEPFCPPPTKYSGTADSGIPLFLSRPHCELKFSHVLETVNLDVLKRAFNWTP
jgi:hypothetical protein